MHRSDPLRAGSRLVLLFTLLSLCNLARAGGVHDWLMRINDAAANLNYQGVFVYGFGSSLESMRVVHQVDEGVVKERLYSLNGAPREIVRDAEKIWCYVPEQQIGVHDFRETSKQSFPNILPESLGDLEQNYALTMGRKGRIADRPAQQILISPRDEYRYGYVLWADQATGLLLQSTLVDSDNNTLEQYMFTEVSIGEFISAADLEPATLKEKLKWFGPTKQTQDSGHQQEIEPGWAIEEVPAGFKLARQIRSMSPIHQSPMEHYVYSDGLAAISVFIEMLDPDSDHPKVNGVNRMGAVHAFGHSKDGYHITVVGEVPSRTVDMVGMSVSKLLQ